MADYSTADAPAFLGLSPSTIRNLADPGELPHRLTEGGHRRFSEAGLLAYRARALGVAPSPAMTAAVWSAAVLAVLHEAEASLGPSSPLSAPFQAAARALRGENHRVRPSE